MKDAIFLYSSPIGTLALVASAKGLRHVVIGISSDSAGKRFPAAVVLTDAADHKIMKNVVTSLDQYFQGELRTFNLPLDFDGLTSFGRTILHALQQVPFGINCSYGELAQITGKPGSARAVGRVMSGNPVPLVVPCHRVLPASGALGNYSGGRGPETKSWLLAFEHDILTAKRSPENSYEC